MLKCSLRGQMLMWQSYIASMQPFQTWQSHIFADHTSSHFKQSQKYFLIILFFPTVNTSNYFSFRSSQHLRVKLSRKNRVGLKEIFDCGFIMSPFSSLARGKAQLSSSTKHSYRVIFFMFGQSNYFCCHKQNRGRSSRVG